jgi:hypothetical protein
MRRLPAIAAVAVISLSVSACSLTGRKEHPTTADGEQLYVDAGPITYQVQLSRELNPYSIEDSQYLAGVPGARSLSPTQLWFAIFLRALNQSGRTQTTTNSFQIVASDGTVYHPVALNPSVNPYAWTATQLPNNQIEPNPDSTAAYGPTQGGLVLFKLDDSVFSNRPLTLDIFAAGQSKPTTVSIDL